VGLHSGEMRALAWTDIDFVKRQVCVAKSVWRSWDIRTSATTDR
jgi:hypothetical protein